MTSPAPIVIEAEVADSEHPFVLAGAQQLAEALAAATGSEWPIQLRYREPGAAVASSMANSVVVLSLLPEVDRDEPFAETQGRLAARLAALVQGTAPVLICTVFRHVAERRTAASAARLERIRRLDRLAAELSADLGFGVVDIDRAFAHIGGRVLATDHRLNGRLAAEVGGHTLAWSLLSVGLDDIVPPEAQERAKAFLGPLREINSLVSRRLAAG
ncbi:MAG TPA: hypothetical protein VHZ26_13665 [Caulobacteraceae bacterium]|jgi:hypothetical protein|nr:hypothetical protein [Caulobacteraceae bacterium]